MKRKERFMTALQLREPDRVPLFDFLFHRGLYEELIGRRPEDYSARDAVECALALDLDGVTVPFRSHAGFEPEYLAEDVYRDEWGTVFQETDTSWPGDAPVDYPIKVRADLIKYRPPDPTVTGRDSEIRAAAKMDHDHIALLGSVRGPLTGAWLLMGFENISYALYDDPALISEVLNISNDYFKEAARLSVEAGCMALFVTEDLGDNNRGFFRLEHFRKHFLPPLADLIEYIDGLDVPVLLHSDGHITDYLEDLTQTKITAIHPLQRIAGMDLRNFKEEYGRRFCIIGNIDCSRTLPFGSPEDVAAEVKEAIDIAAPGGGYILASDNSLHDGIPVENIVEMFRVGREYGGSFYGNQGMPGSDSDSAA